MELKECIKCKKKTAYFRETSKDYRCGQCKEIFKIDGELIKKKSKRRRKMTKEKKIKEKIDRECEKCKSKFGYIKLKTKEWQCRSCGHCTKLED